MRVTDKGQAELEFWVSTDVDAISFMDDWGSQNQLLIDPATWREIFKPLYKQFCDLARAHGKFVFMHSDGNIQSIYPDLIEIGVNAVNSQLFCMDMAELARIAKGKITFWGEIDRQYAMAFGTEEEVQQAVQRVRTSLGDSKGGVIAQCEWGKDNSRENVETVMQSWL